LTDLGLLERLPNRRYRIGIKLWEIAVRTPGALGIREIATPSLQMAHRAIGQHLQLAVLQSGEVLFLERLSAPDAAPNLTIIGGRLPLTATSSGYVLAAFSDQAAQRELLERPRPPFKFTPRLTNAELRAQIDVVRLQGYEVTHGFLHPGATSIAVPVFGPLGTIVAAISAVVPTSDAREEFVLATLNSAARAIRTALGRHYAGDESEY
jgi:DNA-binding IclR family transcriptional regulator